MTLHELKILYEYLDILAIVLLLKFKNVCYDEIEVTIKGDNYEND